jgi:RNA polymerase sigma-70 factor (ECF subfamily)
MGCPVRSEPVAEHEIVARHLAGDARAFGELVTRYRPRLLNFTQRMVGDRDRAEDLVQETFVRVARHLGRFDLTRKFSSWVFVIAANLAKNELRRVRRAPLVFESAAASRHGAESKVLQFADPRGRPDQILADRHRDALVQSTLQRLGARDREILILREFDGLSYDEIGAVLGCKLGAVKSRLNRARARFAVLIAPHLD